MDSNKGLIPWDDDLDLCILQENEEKLIKEIAPILKKVHKIEIIPANSVGYRIFHTENSEPISDNSDLISYKYPFCDIFVMSKTKNKVIIADRTGRTIWPKEKYLLKNIENPRLFSPLKNTESNFRLDSLPREEMIDEQKEGITLVTRRADGI